MRAADRARPTSAKSIGRRWALHPLWRRRGRVYAEGTNSATSVANASGAPWHRALSERPSDVATANPSRRSTLDFFRFFWIFFRFFVPRQADGATDNDFEFGRAGLEMAMPSRTSSPIEMSNRPPLKA